MVSPDTHDQYTVTVGIECHVQFNTRTKLFSAVGNDAREAAPNTLVSHIDMGLPGALPVLNREAVKLAAKAAFALGSRPQPFSKFDRKHYFYPDLPMGYQITQYDEPIILGGHIDIVVDGQPKTIQITRAHMEADAGKSVHPAGKDYSLVDLNRAGTPLLEIVSEPQMHSAAEAKAYARELWLRMRYAGVSDANLYYGNMRFDVNVSVSKTNDLGTRTETKNLNSFRAVEKAVEYEVNRQIEMLEKGEAIIQETRGWDDSKQKTFSQRSKEDAHDYRYFPDPDLPPVVLDQAYIAEVEAAMPLLPADYRELFKQLDIDAQTVEDIVSAPNTAALVARVLQTAGPSHARRIAFWMMRPVDENESVSEERRHESRDTRHNGQDDNTVIPSVAKESRSEIEAGEYLRHGLSTAASDLVRDDQLIKLSQMVEDKKLSSTAAKEVLDELLRSGEDPQKIAEVRNLLQVSDEGAIAEIVKQVLADNPKAADDVRNGEMKAIGFLVGQVMKASQGKANPALAQQLIKQQLEVA